MHELKIEPSGETTTGVCDCCGKQSRRIWGFVYESGIPHAVYYVHWTAGHVADSGALWDIVVGEWGDEATPAERSVARVHYQTGENEGFAVLDADDAAIDGLARNRLKRADIIGKPLAQQIFAVCDAVYLQDGRLHELRS
jgi:hypothetical protein